MSGGGKGSSSYTAGYWYGVGLHMALCHGPVDAVTEIQVGERTAWAGVAPSNTSVGIDQPTLFGGEEREGGVTGTLDILMGDATQTPNAYLQGKLGAAIPAFRGVLSVVWRGWVSAMNPYIKPWRFRVMRIPSAWYPAMADISGDANPSHIIRECLTNADWGMGYPASDIDDASFTVAANTLYSEGFGLSLLWDKESSIEDFILSVLKHVDGMLFVHPRSGQFTLKLARADYDPASLPIFSPSNVLRVEEFSRPSWGEVTNQVTITYRDGATDKDASITVQDIAAVQINGGVVATSVSHPGISRAGLANRVAMRELKQLSSTLAKVTLVANRQASLINIGDAIKWSWPPYGITEMVLRVARIAYGELQNGAVRLECVQDVFALPQSVYSDPPPTGWSDPISLPEPCPAQDIYEVPYWQIVKDVVGEIPSILNDIDPTEGMIATLGARPSPDAISYRVLADDMATGQFKDRGFGIFAPTALTAADLPPTANAVAVPVASAIDLDRVEIGGLAILDGEWMQVTAVGLATPSVTLERGMLDTVPTAHASGSRIWFVDGFAHYVSPEYVVGESPSTKLLPKTGRGTLDESLSPAISLTIAQRFIRPYPPGNALINGQAYPAVISDALTISWANRNRVQQTANLIRQTDGNLTPETGQTTTLRIFDENGALRRVETDLIDTSYAWTLEDTDCGRLQGRLRVEIESSRADTTSTYTSWQVQNIAFDRAGYGLQYGNYYGGL